VSSLKIAEGSATDQLRNEAEAANILGVKPTTLQIWRSTRRYPLPYIKVGRLVRYRQSALDAFLVSRTHSAEAAQ
jgi:predicted DNA-binding transcriptional regulator AlpA